MLEGLNPVYVSEKNNLFGYKWKIHWKEEQYLELSNDCVDIRQKLWNVSNVGKPFTSGADSSASSSSTINAVMVQLSGLFNVAKDRKQFC